jgi:hypothetical protein
MWDIHYPPRDASRVNSSCRSHVNTISQFLQNPVTALVVALALGAVALSGHFSIAATQCLLVAAWVVAVFALWAQPWPVLIGVGSIMAGALVLLGYWFRPDVIPTYSGVLSPRSTLLFSPDGGKTTKIQIGQSRVFIVDPNNPLAAQLYPALRTAQFRVENIDGEAKVSAQMLDREGHLIAELVRNEWKVAPPPNAWDRNYSDEALEVRDARGMVVLQVKALKDRVQLQGLWWIDMGPPNGIRQLTVRENPEGGAQFIISPEDASPPPIVPMFEYPSDRHLGELRKAK